MLKPALAAVGVAVALMVAAVGGAATAFAGDSNDATQKSTQVLCNVVLFSPHAQVEGCYSEQTSSQEMQKTDTENASLIDHTKLNATTAMLP